MIVAIFIVLARELVVNIEMAAGSRTFAND